MGRLVVFSVSSFCLAFVEAAGLAAYTAAHPVGGSLRGRCRRIRAGMSRPCPTKIRSAPGRAPCQEVVG